MQNRIFFHVYFIYRLIAWLADRLVDSIRSIYCIHLASFRFIPSMPSSFKPVSQQSCSPPPVPDDAKLMTSQTRYAVGEVAVLQCKTGKERLEPRCLSDGTWSPSGYVCGGWCQAWFSRVSRTRFWQKSGFSFFKYSYIVMVMIFVTWHPVSREGYTGAKHKSSNHK